VLVEAKGYRAGTVVIHSGSAQPFAEVVLFKPSSASSSALRQISGQVLLPDGKPAADVVVTVQFSQPPVLIGRQFITDPDGKFSLVGNRQLRRVDVTVSAVGAASDKLFSLQLGPAENTLQLTPGATVTGRVLWKTKPVAGAGVVGMTIRYVQEGAAARSVAAPVTYEQVTDSEGRFRFEHVCPDTDLRICTSTRSLAEQNLAGIPREVHAPADGQEIEIGDLNLHPAHRLHGRLVTSHGEAAPADTLAVIERRGTSADWQEVEVDEQGRFEFSAVPSDAVVLSFHTARELFIRGHCLSPKNYSVDYAGQCTLCGRVDDDLELRVLLEPGTSRPYSRGSLPRLYNRGLRDHKFDAQQRIEGETLCGLRPELAQEFENDK
jgi:hypothetical protein